MLLSNTYLLDIVRSPGRRQNTSSAKELAAVETRNRARSTTSSTSRSFASIPFDINVRPGDKRADGSIQKSSLNTVKHFARNLTLSSLATAVKLREVLFENTLVVAAASFSIGCQLTTDWLSGSEQVRRPLENAWHSPVASRHSSHPHSQVYYSIYIPIVSRIPTVRALYQSP